jgi:hypothetical protein
MSELSSLVNDVLLAPDFNSDDFVGFNPSKEHQVMDSYQESSAEGLSSPFAFDDTWIKGTVELSLPCDGIKHQSEVGNGTGKPAGIVGITRTRPHQYPYP